MLQTRPAPEFTDVNAGEHLLRATEAAALAVAPLIGKEDKIGADQQAVDAMHSELSRSGLSTVVVIGEGEKDEAPELENGTIYGDEYPPLYDLAVDPVEGTTFVSKGLPGGMSIAALGERGSFLPWVGIPYMRKLVVGPRAASLLDTGEVNVNGDPGLNMRRIAEALGKPAAELTVAMLDRKRNAHIRFAAEQIGARILLLEGGDVTPALQTCLGRDVDLLYSSGGAPEGVITAAAIAAMGGNMQAMIDPQTKVEEDKAHQLGLLRRVLNLSSLVGDGELHFAATGITASPILTGARQDEDGTWYQGSSIYLSRPRARHTRTRF